jgi:predicted RNA-binding protein with PIN domain
MAAPTYYLFDGHNLLHAGGFTEPRQVSDLLASWLSLKGVRGTVVFDGKGDAQQIGPLEVLWAPHADPVLERLAAERRGREQVCLVSSDVAVKGTAGRQVAQLSSRTFLRDVEPAEQSPAPPGHVADLIDPETRARLERLRRGLDG